MGWSAWIPMSGPRGGFVGRPATLSRNSEVTNVYVRGTDAALWQLACRGRRWAGWSRVDGAVLASAPAAGSSGPGHEAVFAVGADGALWANEWVTDSGWRGWESLGAPDVGLAGAPTAVGRGGRCSVYVRGGDDSLWQLSGVDTRWRRLGGMLVADPAAAATGPGHEVVFGVGAGGDVWSKEWTAATGWSPWVAAGRPGGGIRGGVSAISRAPHLIRLYARGTDDALWERESRHGDWRDWFRHPDGALLTAEPAASSRGGAHELVVHRGRDAQLHLKWWEPTVPTVDVNLIHVDSGWGLPGTARWACLQAGLDVGTINQLRLGSGAAGALSIVDSVAEAEELTDRWGGPCGALDVFLVRSMNAAGGWSMVDTGPGEPGCPASRNGYPVSEAHSNRVAIVAGPAGVAPETAHGEAFYRAALRDPGARDTVRAAAATWLSRSAADEAEAALLAALAAERSVPVRHKIVAGLARVGGEDALSALGELTGPDPDLAAHATFARSVIAHRAGIPGYEPATAEESTLLPVPDGTPDRNLLESGGAVPAAVLPGDTYGLILGPEAAGVRCGRRRIVVAIDLTALTRLLTTPTMAALAAIRDPADGSLHTGLLALCWPASDNTAHVAVHRPHGTPAFAGTAKVAGTSVSFRLTAVHAPGARSGTVTGTITSGVLEHLTVRFGPALRRLAPDPA
jgi:hypothetical protein